MKKKTQPDTNQFKKITSDKNKQVKTAKKIDWKAEKQRLLAEIDNLQKQKQDEMFNHYRFRHEDVFKEMLEIIDALEGSLQFRHSNPETKQFLKGIEITVTKFGKILSDFGVKKITSKVGQQYDPGLHQTLGAEWNSQYDEGTILKVKSDGYLLHERVLRPSKVIINQKSQKSKLDS